LCTFINARSAQQKITIMQTTMPVTAPVRHISLQVSIRDVDFGENVTVIEPVNIYGCKIGSKTFIGPFVEIQKDVIIGESCRIQSHTFVCEMVTMGNKCFIGHGVMFINDLFASGGPAQGNKELWKQTLLGDNIVVGSNATILPVKICSNVVIGAGAVVTKDITKPGIYVGNPAKFLRAI
jgi:acetyltransferase-like isoleucine patch superfamily enzyme